MRGLAADEKGLSAEHIEQRLATVEVDRRARRDHKQLATLRCVGVAEHRCRDVTLRVAGMLLEKRR